MAGWKDQKFACGKTPRRVRTYDIYEDGGIKVIKCLQCGKSSYNQGDVKNRYCAHCGMFHERR